MSLQNKQMLKQIQQMQAKMAEMQEKLADESVEGTAGGGAVTIAVNGHQQVLSVSIAPEALEDAELLSDMVMAACNDALDKARNMASDRMSSLLPSGLPPGLF